MIRKNNILHSLIMAVCIGAGSVSGFADNYKIDLTKVKPSEIKYITPGDPGPVGNEINVTNLYVEENGTPVLPVMGEIHYSRMHPDYWRDALLKMKSSGINIVSTYCLWNLHEEFEGEQKWEGHLNLRRFVKMCDELGMKVHLRIGPYCNAEIRNGGLPDWIVRNQSIQPRSNQKLYLEYVRKWYNAIAAQTKGLMHKDGGPVIGVQLENEYVTKGLIISHLKNLKKMAVEAGLDVPIYSMTHWLDTEFPKGEIIPYAGFYIEAPWTTSGQEEMPTSNFEFFTYNRLSDNIGTDIIKVEGNVESLSSEQMESPFFTCEVGVGTTSFYHRRAIVPQEMAGEMINLRLGCGANIMGYYMYAGGTNPVGKVSTMQSSGPRISYDYQAPVRECGTLGAVMPEVKKYNYFMNDFGTSLAPGVAYLPTSNKYRENLQWGVRAVDNGGYLFCSNYLYRHKRKDYNNVQFSIKLFDETIRLPRRKTTIKDGSYFMWPFNQMFGGVKVKYATVQPIASYVDGDVETFFFFEDDGVSAEYLIGKHGVKSIIANSAEVHAEKDCFFIDGIIPGENCSIDIELDNGKTVRFVSLTEMQSDRFWKGKAHDAEYVCLTESAVVCDGRDLTVIDENPSASLSLFRNGVFRHHSFKTDANCLSSTVSPVGPLMGALSIKGYKTLERRFYLNTSSDIEKAFMRAYSSCMPDIKVNGSSVGLEDVGSYFKCMITELIRKGENLISVIPASENGVAVSIEMLLKNGSRYVWTTDGTWTDEKGNVVIVDSDIELPDVFAPEEHIALYEISAENPKPGNEETRLYVNYIGDVANAYVGNRLVADSYYDGSEWIISLNRMAPEIESTPLTIRIDGLENADAPIYFEKDVDRIGCVNPRIRKVRVNRECHFKMNVD